ncbi:CHAT domain-containing protein [Umezawaea sp.]|uniref:CHAT domain-containing protein n=1 Tax=Umezawaea sp. TaxID=1955258 RepID=UPI002ED5DA82
MFAANRGRKFDLALRVARFDPSPAAVRAAIEAGRLATGPGGEERVRHLSNLGGLLQTRFQQTGDPSYLDEAVAGLLAAIGEESDPGGKARLYANAGALKHTHFTHVRDPEVLADAIGFSRAAVHAAAEGPDRANYQRNLAIALTTAYLENGKLSALHEAIEAARGCATGAEGDDVITAQGLHSFALLVRRLFDATDDVEVLADAIDAERRAVDLTAPGCPERIDRLALLGDLLADRFQWTGAREDLGEAVDVRRTLVAVTPKGHGSYDAHRVDLELAERTWTGVVGTRRADGTVPPSDRTGVRSHRAAELTARYVETGDRAPLDQAVAEARAAVADTRPGHPQLPERIDVLGCALGLLARLDGDHGLLAEAVGLHRRAVETSPGGHTYEARFLGNLGTALAAVFHATGDLVRLTEATAVTRRAVDAATRPDDRTTYLANLAAMLHRRSETTGERAVLDEAVAAAREAVRTGADVVAGHATHLTNLGALLFALWERTRRAATLEECVGLHEEAVRSTPERHPGRPMRLNNLGGALVTAFEQDGDLHALDRGISAHRAAVLGCDPADPDHAGYQASLSGALRQRYLSGSSGGEEELAEAVDLARASVRAGRAGAHRRSSRLIGLGRSLRLLYLDHGDRSALAEALAAFQEAAALPSSPTEDRVIAADLWGELAAKADDYTSAAEGFATAVRLLPLLAGRGVGRGDAQYLLSRFADLAADAAACCLAVGRVDEAVALLELGRGVLAAQALDGRGDLADLREREPELADRFAALGAEFESDTPRDRLELADELAALTAVIRALPGMDRFLRPPLVADLVEQAREGPVVLVNVSRYRCDALVLTPSGVVVQDLLDLTASELRRRVTAFQAAVAVTGPEPAEAEAVVHETLEWLWDTVAGPVLDRLGLTGGTDPPPRLWWAPVGLLGLLPLHAAGHLRTGGPAVLDRVVSSVTPTVRALGHARSRCRGTGEPRLLVVAVPEAEDAEDLPGVLDEAERLTARVPGLTRLVGPDATRDRVLAALRTSTWAHFACHGYSDPVNPSNSGLALSGSVLHVLDVSRQRLDHAEFAYLSACDTARSSVHLSDEAIHPTSAFLVAGFPRVVGTLWRTNDVLAPHLTESIYDDLLEGAPDADRAPFAVHRTVRRIRDRYPDRPSLWAAYVHAGA